MRFRAPASVFLRRAQLTLMLAALVPTILMTALGIILIASGSRSVAVVAGVLVLAFCTSSLTGYILGSIFVSRGASLTRVQTDFLSSVSHELRTPLTSIRMFIETLYDGRVKDPEEQRKCLGIVKDELERLEGLVGRLLELSRLESGRHVFEKLPVDVSELIGDAVAAFQAATLGTEVALSVEAAPGLRVVGDRSTLTQALGNLLTNAWKYGPADGKQIRIAARASGKHVEISVADNGPGIPGDERRRIFEHFERGKAAIDARLPGSGLGLAIVRAIARAHDGRVVLDGDPGHGARFALLLPREAT